MERGAVDSGQWPVADDQTLADCGFYWREREGVRVLVCQPLERAGFVNGFSTRLGGVSQMSVPPAVAGGDLKGSDLNLAGFEEDTAENIRENRRRFLNVFEGDLHLTTAWQVHGADVKIVKTDRDIENTEERFDALVSQLRNVVVGVKTADCGPVLLGDPKTGVFAAVHAGWRGTAKSIAIKAVEKMVEIFGSKPEDLIAAIGPAASGRNYEIGREVIDAFEADLSAGGKYFKLTREGHALVDLPLVNKDQLILAGLSDTNIYIAPFCTIERTDLFFSYRAEKNLYGKTGRLLSVVGKRSRLCALRGISAASAFKI